MSFALVTVLAVGTSVVVVVVAIAVVLLVLSSRRRCVVARSVGHSEATRLGET